MGTGGLGGGEGRAGTAGGGGEAAKGLSTVIAEHLQLEGGVDAVE